MSIVQIEHELTVARGGLLTTNLSSVDIPTTKCLFSKTVLPKQRVLSYIPQFVSNSNFSS